MPTWVGVTLWNTRNNAIRMCPTIGHGGRYRVNIIMLFVRISPEDTVGVIGLIMLFVRPTRGHGGRYRVYAVMHPPSVKDCMCISKDKVHETYETS